VKFLLTGTTVQPLPRTIVITMEPKSPTRDETYYFPDLVTFLVGDRLFRVPKYMLVESSPAFETMFSLPQASDDRVEGRSDENPVRLEGIDPQPFKNLLRLLYPLKSLSQATFTTDEWLSILGLAKKWDMDGVIDLAVKNLADSERLKQPAMKVQLGRNYNHSPWVVEGLMILCEQRESLSVSEAQVLGLNDAVRLAMVREWHIRSNGWRDPSALLEKLRETFTEDDLPRTN